MRLSSQFRWLAPSLALVLASCGGGSTVTVGDDDGSSSKPDEARVRVDVSGGFVPMEYAFRSLPQLTIYGDGLALTQGAMIAIYPGPALTPVSARRLTARGVQEVLDKAEELGLLSEPPDYGQPPVADAPTTTVSLSSGGRTYVHKAEALQETAAMEGEGSQGGPPSQDQREARRRLAEFVAAVGDLRALVGEDDAGEEETWEPVGYRLRSDRAADVPPGSKPKPVPPDSPTSTQGGSGGGSSSGSVSPDEPVSSPPQSAPPDGEPPEPSEPKPELWEWPVDAVDLATVGDCKAVRGDV